MTRFAYGEYLRYEPQDLAARGETPAAFGAPSAAAALGTPFGRRCIPALTPTRWETRVGGPGADCVAPSSHIPDTAPHRAQNARWGPRSAVVAPLRRGPHGADCAPWGGTSGRLAGLGATPDSRHGLPVDATADVHHGLQGGQSDPRQATFERMCS